MNCYVPILGIAVVSACTSGRGQDSCETPPSVTAVFSASGGWTDVSVASPDGGPSTVCGLRDGTAQCLGDEAGFLLGAGLERFVSRADAVCALSADGEIVCSPEVTVSPGPWSAYAFEGAGACGIRPDGRVSCDWSAPPSGTYRAISGSEGSATTCALSTDGGVDCWTFDREVQSLDGVFVAVGADCGIRADGTTVCASEWPDCGPVKAVTDRVAFDQEARCSVATDDQVTCISYRQPFEPGDDALLWLAQPDVSLVSVSGPPFCGVTLDGRVACWRSSVDASPPDLSALLGW